MQIPACAGLPGLGVENDPEPAAQSHSALPLPLPLPSGACNHDALPSFLSSPTSTDLGEDLRVFTRLLWGGGRNLNPSPMPWAYDKEFALPPSSLGTTDFTADFTSGVDEGARV